MIVELNNLLSFYFNLLYNIIFLYFKWLGNKAKKYSKKCKLYTDICEFNVDYIQILFYTLVMIDSLAVKV